MHLVVGLAALVPLNKLCPFAKSGTAHAVCIDKAQPKAATHRSAKIILVKLVNWYFFMLMLKYIIFWEYFP